MSELINPPDGVGAAYELTEPVLEEAGAGGEFQGIEAAHPRPEQNGDDLKTTAVGIRGCRRRSTTPVTMVPENPKTFSA